MSSKAQLKPNPFTTYRDPATGRWIVVQPTKELLPNSVNLSIVSPSIEGLKPCCV
ncbi:hypothetical protein H6F67_24115 [Microcoleus sp. FACHB-1515]|uniref:hypothetical protein n=1 Tax=Cyanophyceae TaxID=3028117 RepID=UPI0016833042|nr:hypothetical protein [Microcoleus sp. FACHB-1515]MBD2092938.1 hypothetical protein [Microcoleus sp. FACHB-1515]